LSAPILVVAVLIFAEPGASAPCKPGASAQSYAAARSAFEEGRFEESIQRLKDAYACDPNPVYLGNIARAYEEAHRPSEAIKAWRAYLDQVTDEKERRLTEGRISVLTKLVDDLDRVERDKEAAEAARQRAEARARLRVEPQPPTSPRVSTAAWIVGAAGMTALVSGVVLGLVAHSRHSAANDEPDVLRANALQRQAQDLAIAANAAYAIGAVAAGTGAVWIAIDLLDSSSPRAPSGAEVTVQGRF
jgi:tetratricopeptide (TPR) repeat protein